VRAWRAGSAAAEQAHVAEDADAIALARKLDLRRCPECSTIIEKNEGCSSMNCYLCGHMVRGIALCYAAAAESVVARIELSTCLLWCSSHGVRPSESRRESHLTLRLTLPKFRKVCLLVTRTARTSNVCRCVRAASSTLHRDRIARCRIIIFVSELTAWSHWVFLYHMHSLEA
jgi:hypothetical protein